MNRRIILPAVFSLLLAGCKIGINSDAEKVSSVKKGNKWSILVYMSADNNLEAEAMADICEMEMSRLNTSDVNVLLLVDRSSGYDTSNGNWTGGKLFQLKTGRKNSEVTMISKELSCADLGLVAGKDTELNMASSYVLTSGLKYMKNSFPADFYGLIMWGHGTGWRSEEGDENLPQEEEQTELFKAFAFDSSSGEYMSLQQIEKGIKESGIKLEYVGFDTCFGGELEIFYQLKDSSVYAVGSEGLVLSSGWNYEALFNEFNSSDKSGVSLCSATVNQFKQQYAHNSKAAICAVDLLQTENVFLSFEKFMECSAERILTSDIRDAVINSLFQNSLLFSYGNAGSDVYVDTVSLVREVSLILEKEDSCICEVKNQFLEEIGKMTVSSWSYDSSEAGPGVYFGVMAESGLFSGIHPSAYIKGKSSEQIAFVSDSCWYVPAKKTGSSFLDKLFYTNDWE